MGAWRGTSNTVSRALALIELGALDENDMDTLAGRLGLGERQLRRLFRQHLGASPVAVAQTRRILLAKQLIHETRLPMAEIAFASDSAVSAASTKPSSRCSVVRPASCDASAVRIARPGRKERSFFCCAITRPTTGRQCWNSCAGARSPVSNPSAPIATPERSS
jgi:methylphosphotriester-DNA--protein-cysteine methyltransferase